MLVTNTKSGASFTPPSPTASPAWKEIVEPVRPFLKEVAERIARQVESFDPEIVPYAEYALTNQGKQLRPLLVALSAGAAGKLNDGVVTAATIVEMVHLATLVHDDVMDEAEIRRQRPTLAANWGNEISVLLGDCLFAQAVRLASGFPTPDVCRAVASATHRVCSGEILQTRNRRNFNFERTEYFRILDMKTAELFALSCELGAALAGGESGKREQLRSFGTALGTAYQIYDDCLDIFGSEAAAGKSLGTDLANGKLTLPLLIVLERGNTADRAQLRGWIEQWDPAFLPGVVEMLQRFDAQAESRAVIHRYLDSARNALMPLAETPSRCALAALADFLAVETDALGCGD